MNLLTTAEANKTDKETRYSTLLVGLSTVEQDQLGKFAGKVLNEGTISINMRPSVLSELLVGRNFQNVYEWSEEMHKLSGRPQHTLIAEKLGVHYTSRLAFDGSFDNGEQFHYAALNIGGVGATHYGQFCTVLKLDFASRCSMIIYLWGDSLNTYVDSSASVNVPAVQRDATPHSHRHFLAVFKHYKDVNKTDERDWPKLLFANDDLIEAIFIGNATLSEVDEVRVLNTEYKKLWTLAFESFGRKMGDAERALITDFISIRRAEIDGIIKVERY